MDRLARTQGAATTSYPPVVPTGRGAAGLVVAAAVAAVVCLASAAPGWATQVLSPPDEGAFQAYVSAYVDGWSTSADPGAPARDKAWVTAHQAEVLAAGYRACDWLGTRPDAPLVDPTWRSDTSTLVTEYVGIDPRSETQSMAATVGPQIGLDPLTIAGRSTVVAGAWGYLCRPTRNTKTAPASLGDD